MAPGAVTKVKQLNVYFQLSVHAPLPAKSRKQPSGGI
jgi:hypothetical protein